MYKSNLERERIETAPEYRWFPHKGGTFFAAKNLNCTTTNSALHPSAERHATSLEFKRAHIRGAAAGDWVVYKVNRVAIDCRAGIHGRAGTG